MHRFSPSLAAASAFAVATALAAAADAGSTSGPPQRQVVTDPAPNGDRLEAWAGEHELCARLAGPPAPGLIDGDAQCAQAPEALPPFGHVLIDGPGSALPKLTFGATGSSVASVTLTRGARTLAQAATYPGSGALSGLRFFLVESKRPAAELHLLDAAGVVRRAIDLDRLGATHIGPPASAQTVARGHQGHLRWRASGYRETRLAPTPLEPLRHDVRTCARLDVPRTGGPLVEVCDHPAPDALGRVITGPGALVASEPACVGAATAFALVAAAPIRRVDAILGDGSRRPAILRGLDGADAAVRAGVVVVAPDRAVRALEARDGGGRLVASAAVARPPGRSGCGRHGLGPAAAPPALDPDAGLPAGGPDDERVAAADRGAELCLAPGAADAPRASCGLPPSDPLDARLTTRLTGGHRVLFGAVPPEVARAEITLDDGAILPAVAEPLPAGYSGRYAGVERLVQAALPLPRRAVRVRLLDADGRELATPPAERPPLHVVRSVRAPGAPPLLVAARVDRLQPAYGTACVTLGPLPEGDCAVATPGTVEVDVRCRPRRTVVFGWLRRPADRLVLRTATGRTIAGRTARVPGGLSVTSGRPVSGAAIAVAPSSSRVAEILVRGRRTHRRALAVPPAARQCGYAGTLLLG